MWGQDYLLHDCVIILWHFRSRTFRLWSVDAEHTAEIAFYLGRSSGGGEA